MARAQRSPAAERITPSPLDPAADDEAATGPPANHSPGPPDAAPAESDGAPRLRTVRPEPAPPRAVIVVEGEYGSGKSRACVELSADERAGRTLYLELPRTGTARHYASVPGADYEIIDHDGTWNDICTQVRAVRAEAERARAAGEAPVVLIVDTISAAWTQTKRWVYQRAAQSQRSLALRAYDPHAEISVGFGYWQEAKDRWNALMRELSAVPGVVVLCARGHETSEVDAAGEATGRRVWRTDAERDIAYEATAVVRMRRGAAPRVVKCATAERAGDPPQEGSVLGWLAFEVLGAG